MKNIISLLLASLLAAVPVFAQEEHTHADGTTHAAHGDEAAPGAQSGLEYFTIYSESPQYELVLRYPELAAGKAAELTLFLADFASNRPLAEVEIKVTVQEDPSVVFSVEAQEPGVYHLGGTFPKEQAYSLALNLQSKSNGADLQLLKSVEVGKKLPKPEAAVEASEPAGISGKMLLMFAGGLLAGLLLMFFFRRKPRVAAMLLIALSVPAFFQDASAHGDEPHGDEKKGGQGGSSIFIPKETQFLFNILTQPIGSGNFSPAIQLFGTIVSAPSGFADIITPQNARVTSLKVQPGQRVSVGQVVAVLRPSTNQAEQIGVAIEAGRLNAEIQSARTELVAAEREMNRLRAIADVAAKRDVQAAEARYNAARVHLDALQSTASGAVSGAVNGSIVLKSPVAGVVGQFTLAPGAEVPGGTKLFSITNLNKVYVEAQVYDRDAEVVHNAGKFTVTCSNDDHKTAEVRLVSAAQEVNPTNQSQRVLFELSNPDGEFKIGEFVTLQAFQRVTDKQIFVSNAALSEINGKPVVFHKHSPEEYALSYVSLGEENGTHTVVLKGVGEGERLVTAGTYQVKMMLLNQ